jgi:hypothetical protein
MDNKVAFWSKTVKRGQKATKRQMSHKPGEIWKTSWLFGLKWSKGAKKKQNNKTTNTGQMNAHSTLRQTYRDEFLIGSLL